MRSFHQIFSAVHFFLCLFLLTLGLAIFFLPSFFEIRARILEFLENDKALRLAGGIFIGVSLFMFWGITKTNDIRFYQVSMNTPNLEVQLDAHLIESCVESYWTKHFTEEVFLQNVFLRKDGSWEVIAKFSSLDIERQHEILKITEVDLGNMFETKFGYKKPFLVTAIMPS